MDFRSAISAILAAFRPGVSVDTAVGQIAVHPVDLGQVSGTADRAHVHLQLLVAAVVAVGQGQVHTLVVAQIHGSSDQALDGLDVVIDGVTDILDLSAVAQAPRNGLPGPASRMGVRSSVTWQWKLLLT